MNMPHFLWAVKKLDKQINMMPIVIKKRPNQQ